MELGIMYKVNKEVGHQVKLFLCPLGNSVTVRVTTILLE